MKSYTNIEQSNKLVEILSPESADMIYCYTKKEDKLVYPIPIYLTGTLTNTFKYLYCWSLSALLKEIPEVINFNGDENDYALKILKENNLYYLSYGNPLEHDKIKIEPQEHFVDTCYNMILKLHELKLL